MVHDYGIGWKDELRQSELVAVRQFCSWTLIAAIWVVTHGMEVRTQVVAMVKDGGSRQGGGDMMEDEV